MEYRFRLVDDIIATQMSASTLQGITKSIVTQALTEGKSMDFILDLLKTSARTVSDTISATDMFFWNREPPRSRRTHEGMVINSLMINVLECVVLPAVCGSYVLHVGHPVPRIIRRIFYDDPEFKTFYTENGAISCTSPIALTVNGHAAVIPSSGASLYFVEMLNRFDSMGGFTAIVKRLRGSFIPMTLEEMEAYAAVFCVGRCCCTKSFYRRYWNDVFAGFQIRMEGFNTVLSARTDVDAAVRNIVSKLNSCGAVPAYVDHVNECMLDADKCVSAMQYGTGSRFAFLSALVA